VIIGLLTLAVIGSLGFALTRGPDESELRRARSDVAECRTEVGELKDKLQKTRAALTQVIDRPNAIKLDDAELLRLVGRAPPAGPRGGDLSQDAVLQVVRANKSQFQACYQRALKKNSDLRGASITMNLAFAVRGNGAVSDIQLGPRVDDGLIACMRTSLGRWRFPAFGGEPVRVEIPIPLVPKE
jgi:hypothetical protein